MLVPATIVSNTVIVPGFKRPAPPPIKRFDEIEETRFIEQTDELKRHPGVSRARVTQVLNRLNEADDESAKRRFGDAGKYRSSV